MVISPLELRHIVETAFFPLHCRCSSNARREITIEVFDPVYGSVVVMGGVPAETLGNSRAISDFIAQIRSEVSLIKAGTPLPGRGQSSSVTGVH
ncbi:DUF1652 domain-containing protein [Pseudomonas lutea]